ncbi:atlastin-like [Chironomus tepperi]|uniref:atlastin-like n=1 Tax=Chironomus tepperi TaxID=113505 RepID=UPI00391EE379
MSHSHQFGSPKGVLTFSDTKEVIVNYEELDRIFSHPEIQDRKVVILSVIGAFRSGKSFFLDYCLRFLYAHFPSISNPWNQSFIFEKNPNWMGDSNEPLTGFSWQAGSNRDTIGVVFWSDVFLHTIDISGEKIAIFVMDTQGLFDTDSTILDNSRIFSLGTLLSSIQVLNFNHHIQEDQLQYLQNAIELTKYNADIKGKPFQKLLFLIRDWNHGDDYKFGFQGGRKYQKKLLELKPKNDDQHSVRQSIIDNFDHIDSCLLPHPGKTVARTRTYNGCWSEMDKDFRVELKNIIENILDPQNMIKKTLNLREIRVKDFKSLIHEYFKLFQSKSLPKPKSMYEMTVESQLNNLVENKVDDYKMKIYRNRDLLDEKTAPVIHNYCKNKVVEDFSKEQKMGSADHAIKYELKLSNDIDSTFNMISNIKNSRPDDLKEIETDLESKRMKEKNKKAEIENDLKQTENYKQKLYKMLESNEIDKETYDKISKILKKRIKSNQKRLKGVDDKEREESSFQKYLEKFISITGKSNFCNIL